MKLLEEAELTAKIEAELPAIIQTVDSAARPYLAAYQQVQKTNRRVVILFTIGLIVLIIGANLGLPVLVAVAFLSLFSSAVIFLLGWRKTELRKQSGKFTIISHTTITEAVYRLVGFLNPKLENPGISLITQIQSFEKKKSLEQRESVGVDVKALVDTSELITEPANGFKYDDVVISTWQEKTVTVAELDVTHTTGSGKNRHTKQVFKGLFLHIGTSLTTTGKTFLSTDGDRDGFGHQSFWSNLTGTAGVKETTLEWNEFEDAFHVATDNPIEARYIFTPDFMHVLYDFWQTDKRNIRISVIGNNLYILCPTNNVKMYRSIKDLEPQTIRDEVFSLAKTLLLLMRLLQVVSMRTGR